MGSGVWVYIDHFKGNGLAASWEAMSVAKSVASQLDTSVTVLVFGHQIDELVIITWAHEFEIQRRSFELLADSFDLSVMSDQSFEA